MCEQKPYPKWYLQTSGASVVKTAQQQQSRETLARGPLTAARVKQNSAATSMAPLVYYESENNLGKHRLNTNNSDPPIAVRHLLPLQLSIGLDLSTACKP